MQDNISKVLFTFLFISSNRHPTLLLSVLSASMPSVMEKLRVGGSEPTIKYNNQGSLSVSLSEPNLANFDEHQTLPSLASSTLMTPREHKPDIPTVHINTIGEHGLPEQKKDLGDSPSQLAHVDSTVMNQRTAQAKDFTAKYTAEKRHPDINGTESDIPTREMHGKNFTLAGRPLELEKGRALQYIKHVSITHQQQSPQPSQTSGFKAEPEHDETKGERGDLESISKGSKSTLSTRSEGTNSRSLVLPSLTFGAQRLKSAGDYVRPMCGDNDDLISYPGNGNIRVSDRDFRLLKRKSYTKRGMNVTPRETAQLRSTDELRRCLSIHPTGNSISDSRDESIKLRHHTQFMQRQSTGNTNNPYQNMLKHGKSNRPLRPAVQFDSLDSYLSFNKSTQHEKAEPVLLQASRVPGHCFPNTAYSDTHLLKMIYEMNRPKSRTASARMVVGEKAVSELGEFLRVKTPRLDSRVTKPRGERAVGAPTVHVAKETNE